MRGSEYSAPRDARSAGRVGAGGREPGQSVCVRYGKAQSSGFAAGRAVLGKDRLLAGFKVIMSAGRGGAAAQLAVAAAFIAAWVVPNSTELAVANGDTRTVVLSDQHTNESGSFTFMVNGVYDQAVLDKLNWFCRDWRINEPTKMDPHLFDIIWEVYRESGSTQPIDVLSAYRSPQTNAMLRRRSRQVAEHSQHMEGKAIDAHFIDVGPARIRDIAMRMEEGGVGFYPTGVTWVHIDSGSVRYWPRMSRDALTRLFPDGKTVFIPADGQPMPGYEQARAEIEARGGQVQVAGGGFGIFSWLFGRGGGADDAEEAGGQEATTATATTGNARGGRGGGGGGAVEPQVEVADAGPDVVAKAKRNLPTGHAYAEPVESAPAPAGKQELESGPDAVAMAKRNLPTGPAYASAPEPMPPVKPEVVATLEQPDIASDASPIQTHGAFGAKSFGPLPPRRPADLDIAVALAGAPMPPARPAELILASAANQSGGAVLIPPSSIAQRGLLPKVITAGVDTAPTGALALAETQPGQKYDDSALLARAAELTVSLPPMPIPNTSTAPSQPAATASQPKALGGSGVLHSAKVAAQDLARMFGGLPFGAFKTAAPAAAPSGDLRGPQQ